jgi:gamma-glutamyltranspeptidase / glutathione hydrolase
MNILKNSMKFLLIFALTLATCIFPANTKAYRGEPVRAKNAMVASQHELASRIGVEIMKKGGNAVDAAVAVGLALAVVYPEAGNLGGGGFMVIRTKDGKFTTIDYREMAPAKATRDIYLDESGEVIRGEGGSVIGYRAAGVPGTPAGFEYAHKKYGSGKIGWKELIEPARRLAAEGYVLSYRLAELFKSYKNNLESYEDSKRIFLNNGDYFEEGDLFKQTDLAATLARMKNGGAREFYQGETARLIAADMKRNDGLITLEDLKNYVVKERVPIRGTYRGHEIVSMPPPSSGGIVLIQILNMLEKYDLDKMGHSSAAKYHVLTETMRRAFADRAEYIGDPDYADVPTDRLIQKDYALDRTKTIEPTKASNSQEIRFGEIAGKESLDTTHYTVIDKDGTVVSNTYTINNIYGSAVTAKGTGVLLNDEMDDFAAQPGKPNLFGLVQGERNAVGAKKRPLSSMTPTIVLKKDGSFWFAVGARGGPRIITAVLQTTINMIDHEMNIQQAVDAPRIHHQWLPDYIMFEPYGMSVDSRSILEKYGHKFAAGAGSLASATAVAVDEQGTRLGAIDSRSDGQAVGY